MAVNPPVVISTTPNTQVAPERKLVAVGIISVGVAILALGVVAATFPQLGATPAEALKDGAGLIAMGTAVIWDRQVQAE